MGIINRTDGFVCVVNSALRDESLCWNKGDGGWGLFLSGSKPSLFVSSPWCPARELLPGTSVLNLPTEAAGAVISDG